MPGKFFPVIRLDYIKNQPNVFSKKAIFDKARLISTDQHWQDFL